EAKYAPDAFRKSLNPQEIFPKSLPGEMTAQNHRIYEFDDFQLDPFERSLSRAGQRVPLHAKAVELLVALILNRGQLLTKDELFSLVWPDQIVEESNLTVTMSAIRRALGERANQPRYITTVSGRGYRFTAEVRERAMDELTIERESFTRATIEHEVESDDQDIVLDSGFRSGHSSQNAGAVAVAPSGDAAVARTKPVVTPPRLSTPLMVASGILLLLLAGTLGIVVTRWWTRSHARANAGALAWQNVTMRRFATQG